MATSFVRLLLAILLSVSKIAFSQSDLKFSFENLSGVLTHEQMEKVKELPLYLHKILANVDSQGIIQTFDGMEKLTPQSKGG